jgi:hypothetical protein
MLHKITEVNEGTAEGWCSRCASAVDVYRNGDAWRCGVATRAAARLRYEQQNPNARRYKRH